MFFLEKKTKLNPNTWGGCEYLSRCCRDLPWQIFANFPGAEPGWPLPVFLGFGGNLRAFDSRILPSALTLSPFFFLPVSSMSTDGSFGTAGNSDAQQSLQSFWPRVMEEIRNLTVVSVSSSCAISGGLASFWTCSCCSWGWLFTHGEVALRADHRRARFWTVCYNPQNLGQALEERRRLLNV